MNDLSSHARRIVLTDVPMRLHRGHDSADGLYEGEGAVVYKDVTDKIIHEVRRR